MGKAKDSEISIVPSCDSCAQRSLEDPGYWDKFVGCRGLRRGDLMSINGSESGDGVARGKLRLVRDDDEK